MTFEEISPAVCRQWLASDEPPVLLDVREAWEVALAAISGSLHIPMGEIPSRTGELNPEGRIVVVCKSGERSACVAEYLNQQGFGAVFNLTGGVTAWSHDVDPSLPTY